MTPWRSRKSRKSRKHANSRGRSTMPSLAEIEAWAAEDEGERDYVYVAFDALMIQYLAGALSPAERQIVEDRMRIDPTFFARAAELTRIWNLPAESDFDERAEAERILKEIQAHIEHAQQAIEIVEAFARGPSPRPVRTPSPVQMLQPEEFVERLADEIRTESVEELVDQACRLLEERENCDEWIRAVAVGRKRRIISPAVAHFLIWTFAVTGAVPLTDMNTVFSSLNAEISDVKRELGLGQYEGWDSDDEVGRELDELYDALATEFTDQVMNVFLRNGEHEVLVAYAAEDYSEYELGRLELFGN